MKSEPKRVLVITYYWPPSGGAGVQRWLKTTKYLPENGWIPVVYTPENPERPAVDKSLLKDIPEHAEVVKRKIWEPYQLYGALLGKKKEDHSSYLPDAKNKKVSLTKKLAVWVRGNLILPDPRKFWIRPSTRFLVKYLKKNPVDAIISTGPPHSMHLIARNVKRKTGIPWIADFRDPWTFIDFYDQLNSSEKADRRNKAMEESVVKEANRRVTVSKSWGAKYEEMYGQPFDIIHNGFDPQDFEEIAFEKDRSFSVCHIGSLNKDRNSDVFWEAVHQFAQENQVFSESLTIRLIGKTHPTVFESIEKFNLTTHLEHVDYMAHNEVVSQIFASQLLLLLLNDTPNISGIIPGKLYEYLATGNPILCIGSLQGDTAKILNETEGGTMLDFQDLEGMKKALGNYFQEYQKGTLNSTDGSKLQPYSRDFQAKLFSDLLSETLTSR